LVPHAIVRASTAAVRNRTVVLRRARDGISPITESGAEPDRPEGIGPGRVPAWCV